MLTRMLKAELEKTKQTDLSQEADITALESAVGTVPEESDDLQTQVTALGTKVGEVPSGESNDLQSQVTALGVRVKALEDAASGTS